jgi:hypothetical protein
MGMTAPVAVDPVAHVNKLFSNDDLERSGLVQIDAIHVYQYRKPLLPQQVDVRAADRC